MTPWFLLAGGTHGVCIEFAKLIPYLPIEQRFLESRVK